MDTPYMNKNNTYKVLILFFVWSQVSLCHAAGINESSDYSILKSFCVDKVMKQTINEVSGKYITIRELVVDPNSNEFYFISKRVPFEKQDESGKILSIDKSIDNGEIRSMNECLFFAKDLNGWTTFVPMHENILKDRLEYITIQNMPILSARLTVLAESMKKAVREKNTGKAIEYSQMIQDVKNPKNTFKHEVLYNGKKINYEYKLGSNGIIESGYGREGSNIVFRVQNAFLERNAFASNLQKIKKFSGSVDAKEATLVKFFGFGLRKFGSEVVVNRVFENTPAWLSGIREGDILVEINDHKTANTSLSDVLRMIRQSETVRLVLKKSQGGKAVNIELKDKVLVNGHLQERDFQ